MSISIDTPNRATEILQSVDGLEALQAALQTMVDSIEPTLGEVQASPTANTILDRLKRLEDSLGLVSSNPAANTIQARLKSIEAALTAISGAANTIASPITETVAATATNLFAADSETKFISFENTSAVTIYLGRDNNVTTTNYDFKLAANERASLDYSGAVWAIVATGTASIHARKYSKV
jgi:hypothetical protein